VIAREAGISQPYLFRLFRTKQELFLACDERACEKVLEVLRQAAAGAPLAEKLAAMGRAYTDELCPTARRSHDHAWPSRLPSWHAHPNDVWAFLANGIVLTFVAALELQEMAVTHPRRSRQLTR
jgi:AcrR family transcriptional regulator